MRAFGRRPFFGDNRGSRVKPESAKLTVIVSPVVVNGTAVLRAFGRLGAHTVAVASNPDTPGFASRCAGEKVALPGCGGERGVFTRWLLSREDLHGGIVIPTSDELVAELNEYRQDLQGKYLLAIPPPYACEVALDKALLAQLCEETGIPSPVTVKVTESTDLSSAGGLSFPVLVKPCYGADFQRTYTDKVVLARTEDDLKPLIDECMDRDFEVVLQEPLPAEGEVWSYSAYVDRRGRVRGEYTSRRIGMVPPNLGVGFFEAAEEMEPILQKGRLLVSATRYAGALVNLDFKQDPRDGLYKLIDLNARSWRQVSMAARAGVDVFDMLRRDYSGEEPLPVPAAKYGDYWLSVKDAMQVWRAYPKDSPPLRQYLKCLTHPTAFALFDWRDPRPAWKDIAPLIRRRFGLSGRR